MKCAVSSCPDPRTPGSSYCERHGPTQTRKRTIAAVQLEPRHVDTGLVQLFAPSADGTTVRVRPAKLEILEFTDFRTDDRRILSQTLNLVYLDDAGEEINDDQVDSVEAATELALAAYGIRREDWIPPNAM